MQAAKTHSRLLSTCAALALLANPPCLPHTVYAALAAQVPAPKATLRSADFSSIAEMEAACAKTGTTTCTVFVDAPQTINPGSSTDFPRNLLLVFSPTGLWQLQNGSIDFAGATIEAPSDRRIFAGAGSVRNLSSTRPEWFAEKAGDVYPAVALAAAFRASIVNGTIFLRAASYVSPFAGPASVGSAASDQIAYDSTRLFVGVSRPVPDSESSPTKLQRGSVILGEIRGNAALRAVHLGVDDGDAVATQFFGGAKGWGIALLSTARLRTVQGTALEDVAVLTNGVRDQHSVIIEGQFRATIKNLWIWTQGGTHGLVIKSADTKVSDYHCRGAIADCLIVKSDYITDKAGYSENVDIDGVQILPLRETGDTAGIFIDSRWDAVKSLTIRNIVEERLRYGMIATGSSFHTLQNTSVSNWQAHEMAGQCLLVQEASSFAVRHFDCTISPAVRGAAMSLRGKDISLEEGSIACAPFSAKCLSAKADGAWIIGGHTLLKDVMGKDLGGCLYRAADRDGVRADHLAIQGMGERLASGYEVPPVPLRVRWYILKPNLRIMWTFVRVRMTAANEAAALLIFVICAVLYAIARARRVKTTA